MVCVAKGGVESTCHETCICWWLAVSVKKHRSEVSGGALYYGGENLWGIMGHYALLDTCQETA